MGLGLEEERGILLSFRQLLPDFAISQKESNDGIKVKMSRKELLELYESHINLVLVYYEFKLLVLAHALLLHY